MVVEVWARSVIRIRGQDLPARDSAQTKQQRHGLKFNSVFERVSWTASAFGSSAAPAARCLQLYDIAAVPDEHRIQPGPSRQRGHHEKKHTANCLWSAGISNGDSHLFCTIQRQRTGYRARSQRQRSSRSASQLSQFANRRPTASDERFHRFVSIRQCCAGQLLSFDNGGWVCAGNRDL